eukprot:7981058-Karenia_brevis.AAC.1
MNGGRIAVEPERVDTPQRSAVGCVEPQYPAGGAPPGGGALSVVSAHDMMMLQVQKDMVEAQKEMFLAMKDLKKSGGADGT